MEIQNLNSSGGCARAWAERSLSLARYATVLNFLLDWVEWGSSEGHLVVIVGTVTLLLRECLWQEPFFSYINGLTSVQPSIFCFLSGGIFDPINSPRPWQNITQIIVITPIMRCKINIRMFIFQLHFHRISFLLFLFDNGLGLFDAKLFFYLFWTMSPDIMEVIR